MLVIVVLGSRPKPIYFYPYCLLYAAMTAHQYADFRDTWERVRGCSVIAQLVEAAVAWARAYALA